MVHIPYAKSHRKPIDLISDLEEKGLNFKDKALAEHILSFISYYRFKIYLFQFMYQDEEGKKQFRDGIFFENGLDIYRFDESLRNYIFRIISRLEIKFRSRLDHTISEYTDDPFWYLDDKNFFNKKANKINLLRSKLSNSFTSCNEKYAIHYKEKYYNEKNDNYKSLPPFWIIGELATLGNIFVIYDCLDKRRFQISERENILNNLSKEFGVKKFETLVGWISGLRDVRNKCAHHNRLWNSNLRAPAEIIPHLSIPPTNNNRIYVFLATLHHLSKILKLGVNVGQDIHTLAHEFPRVIPLLHSAGFPESWNTDPFWEL